MENLQTLLRTLCTKESADSFHNFVHKVVKRVDTNLCQTPPFWFCDPWVTKTPKVVILVILVQQEMRENHVFVFSSFSCFSHFFVFSPFSSLLDTKVREKGVRGLQTLFTTLCTKEFADSFENFVHKVVERGDT